MTRACILVQALSGKGKTFFSTQGGKPLYLSPESKCRVTVKAINPDAFVFPMDTKVDYDKAIAMVQRAELVEKGYTRIVLDSFSELTEMMPEWLSMGFPLQIQDYGTIGNKAMELVRAILKAPIPSIIISRSEAKEQGKIHRIVPGSLGKSAASLPAKCVLTAETRFDEKLGWCVDTTPDDYTQRAGLPWVPSIFQGSADEFLTLVEAGPSATTVTTQTRIEAAGKAADAMQAERQAPTTPGEVFSQMDPKPAQPVSTETHEFVDGLTPIKWCSPEECVEVTDLAGRHLPKLLGALGAYLHAKGVMPDPKNWTRMTKEGHDKILPSLQDEQKRRALIAHLSTQYAAHAA